MAPQSDFRYAPYWCEENAVLLAEQLGLRELSVVFITNPDRMVALANQRAGDDEAGLAIWDYHVVVVDRRDPRSPLLWDHDSTLGMPVTVRTWVEGTFDVLGDLVSALPPYFRVVDALLCLETFASDRSHMRLPDGVFAKPPPPWPSLGTGESNLDRFLSLDEPFIGELFDLEAFVAWACPNDAHGVGLV